MDILVLKAIGGVGLFLLGMHILTDGLKSLAGNALRNFLRRSTRSPLTGAISGAISTAILQSSSATTVATVGFVGAGLITFPQALGIIFGANIGTTITGWLVAILGFKLHLGVVVTPFVLVGALLNIFASGVWRHIGWALAGFCLLFIGIEAMQEGMAFLADLVSPSDFPDNTFIGRLQLVFIGMAITIVSQSSSAGVAVALAALSAGAISFPQAAAMVIGMDVGTTFTAALATLGGSTATLRTGYAHVIYNLMTGVMAFALLTPLGWIVESDAVQARGFDPQLALVAFHSAFNLIGVVAVVGFTQQFAALMIRLVPERGHPLTERLDHRLLSDRAAATDAMAATIDEISVTLFDVLEDQLRGSGSSASDRKLRDIGQALETVQRYAEQVAGVPDQEAIRTRFSSTVHALDHLIRLRDRCTQDNRIRSILEDAALTGLATELTTALEALPSENYSEADEQRLDSLRKHFRKARASYREHCISDQSPEQINLDALIARLDSARWLHRVAYHIWRIIHHQIIAHSIAPATTIETEAELDFEED